MNGMKKNIKEFFNGNVIGTFSEVEIWRLRELEYIREDCSIRRKDVEFVVVIDFKEIFELGDGIEFLNPIWRSI